MKQDFSWIDLPAELAAKRLLGSELVSEIDGQKVVVKIVETEGYDQKDEASHTFRGLAQRNSAMFLGAGHLYVYFTYGMHHCANIVCGQAGFGSDVLIRAVEPIEGQNIIEKRRGLTGINTTNGPAKVCQALAISLSLSGHDLSQSPIKLIKKPALNNSLITASKRVGISRAVDELRRFYISGNPYVSKK